MEFGIVKVNNRLTRWRLIPGLPKGTRITGLTEENAFNRLSELGWHRFGTDVSQKVIVVVSPESTSQRDWVLYEHSVNGLVVTAQDVSLRGGWDMYGCRSEGVSPIMVSNGRRLLEKLEISIKGIVHARLYLYEPGVSVIQLEPLPRRKSG